MPPSDDQQITTVTRRRSRVVAAALAVLLGIGGASMIGYAIGDQQVAPQPSLATDDPRSPELASPASQPSADGQQG